MTGPKALVDSKLMNTKPDLVVKGKKKSVLVHRISFLCISPYFQRYFKYNPKRNTDGYYELHLKDVSDTVLIQICAYSSDGTIDIYEHTVFDLLSAADMYNIIGIINCCKRFLLQSISPINCFDIYISAHYYNCGDLKKSVADYISKNNVLNEGLSCRQLTIELILDIWYKQNIQ